MCIRDRVMVRRSERALGQSIRGGQERGEITKRGEGGVQGDYVRGGLPVRGAKGLGKTFCSPSDFASPAELVGNQAGIYDLTDDVTDDDFETAIEGAKDEGNVSRANVVRKIKAPSESTFSGQQSAKWDRIANLAASGSSTPQIARDVGMSEGGVKHGAKMRGIDIRADRVVGRTRRLDSNRIIRESVDALENIVNGLTLVNYDDIDLEEAQTWADSLTKSISALSKANRQIKESLQ